MQGPTMAGWLLVALCAAASAYCLIRSRAGAERDPARRGQARGEGLMALGMAAMALPAAVVPVPGWSAWAFVAAFGATGLWALAARHPHHAVGSLAMVYMALVMTTAQAGAGHAGHAAHGGAGGIPVLTGLLLAYFAVHAVASGIRLIPAPAVVPASGPPAVPRPELLNACRTAMSVGMFTMLLTV
ncbi:DUF5134 domain-containing protein [Streptomyces purpurogeneiscleroticus]|uniref:DUF5134 domain-containing protein n=1 Tax=Streptomyces purpurogeneiscleroticus TaxID=68259 RepID=UPI001CBEC845|nr:DUF5134 domain-containing protein [Streptomyces purpurogeneiscleroticus]MBZ4015981.1 DUF5134 domain-containing protein [Streptomyces purpurogeneiscleroticus]